MTGRPVVGIDPARWGGVSIEVFDKTGYAPGGVVGATSFTVPDYERSAENGFGVAAGGFALISEKRWQELQDFPGDIVLPAPSPPGSLSLTYTGPALYLFRLTHPPYPVGQLESALLTDTSLWIVAVVKIQSERRRTP